MADPVPNNAQPGWFLRGIVAPLCRAWACLRERLLALKPCRVSVLMVLAGLVFFLAVPQGEDVVRALAEREPGPSDEWHRACFFVAALAWSWSGWYWARVMLSLKFPDVPGDARLNRMRIWVPRLLGFLATFGVAAALYLASLGYDDREHHAVKLALERYAFWCALGAVFFLTLVSLRRSISRAVYDRVKGLSLAQGRIATPIVGLLDVRSGAEEIFGSLEFSDLKPFTRALLLLAILAAGALLLLFAFALQPSAPLIGTAAILLLAATGWIAVGSTIDFIGTRLELPVFSTLLVLAIVFGLFNENHDVRTLAAAPGGGEPRPDLRAALRSWIARQPARPDGSIPMVLVDAEGGGIRAAYWTAIVLGRIQDRNPCFAEQLFSLSGVSGGSLGASVFVALLAEQRGAGGASACRGGTAPFSIEAKARDILGEDFLSPVVAAFLYPDLAQRLIPLPVRSFDRALALEESWERAWRKHTGTNRFAEPLERLWQDPAAWTPALLLNATWVESGKRLIASNLRLRVPGTDEDFVDVADAREFFAPRSLRLSTAAHMSARFTYVSPAGALKKGGVVHGYVVDGGYFENSGATATVEILETLPILEKEDPRWASVDPVVIHISNEPAVVPAVPDTLEKAPENPGLRPSPWLNESLSPIRAMLNTRNARGVHARETAYWHVDRGNFLRFGLCRRSANIPLGWVLSRSTQDRMKAQLDPPYTESRAEPCSFDNAGNLDRIRARVSAATGK